MNYRNTDILAGEDASTAKTKTIDITLEDIISRISIRYKGTNSSSDPTAHPAAMVSKIELIDGSDVLFSLSGYEALAMDFYDTRRQKLDILNYADDEMCIPVFNINFGRFLNDPVLAFDPKKFNNPQLKITHNKASGGSAPDAGNLRVAADVFDEKAVTPTGFLMSKEHYTYTCGADGSVEPIVMPTDYPYRKMLVMARLADYHPWQVVNEIKLDENNDKKIPMDRKVSDWSAYMASVYPPVEEMMRFIGAAGTSNEYFITPSYEAVVLPVSRSTAGHFLTGLPYGGAVDITPEQAGDNFSLVHGWMPHGAIPVPFGLQDDIGDWYDVTGIGNLRLRLKAGSAATSGEPAVVLQQMRSY